MSSWFTGGRLAPTILLLVGGCVPAVDLDLPNVPSEELYDATGGLYSLSEARWTDRDYDGDTLRLRFDDGVEPDARAQLDALLSAAEDAEVRDGELTLERDGQSVPVRVGEAEPCVEVLEALEPSGSSGAACGLCARAANDWDPRVEHILVQVRSNPDFDRVDALATTPLLLDGEPTGLSARDLRLRWEGSASYGRLELMFVALSSGGEGRSVRPCGRILAQRLPPELVGAVGFPTMARELRGHSWTQTPSGLARLLGWTGGGIGLVALGLLGWVWRRKRSRVWEAPSVWEDHCALCESREVTLRGGSADYLCKDCGFDTRAVEGIAGTMLAERLTTLDLVLSELRQAQSIATTVTRYHDAEVVLSHFSDAEVAQDKALEKLGDACRTALYAAEHLRSLADPPFPPAELETLPGESAYRVMGMLERAIEATEADLGRVRTEIRALASS